MADPESGDRPEPSLVFASEKRPEENVCMKVVVDYDLCEANALCMRSAPEIFRVEEDDTLTVLIDVVPDKLKEKAREAARLCPRQAITYEE